MPAKSEAALERKRKRNIERNVERRQGWRSTEDHCITLDQQHTITKATDLSQSTLANSKVIGCGDAATGRANLTLEDSKTGEVILQKITPSSYDKMLELRASAEVGKAHYDRYLEKKVSAWTVKKVSTNVVKPSHKFKISKRKVVEHHLGIWHTTGKKTLDFTEDTMNPKYKDEALQLLGWARSHSQLALKSAPIHQSFAANIKARSKGRSWLESIFGKRSIKQLLYKSWTTVAFFSNFAGGIHRDEKDCIPSFLFNFGEAAWLDLPEFSAKILIQPLDVVILNSHTFHHRTGPFETDSSNRWAFSGFFRTSIYNMESVCSIAQHRLDSIFGKES